MVPFNARHSVIADVLAAVAIGTAAGSLGGGLFAHYLSWRLVFGLTAVVAAVLVVAMRRLPESDIASPPGDRKSTRLNSSHGSISYAVFCLKKKKQHKQV